MKIELDAARWPLLVARFPPEATEGDIARFYAEWQEIGQRGAHGILTDLTQLNPLRVPAKLRRAAALEVRARRAFFEEKLIAEVRVVSSPLTRGVLTAFDWLIGDYSHPRKNFVNRSDGERWIVEELARRGVGARAERAAGDPPE